MGESQSGFTLVELLIAVALILMICLAGILRLGDSIEEHELSAAALALAADLHWLRQMSVNSPTGAGGPVFSMTFDHAGGRSYQVNGGIKIVKRIQLPSSVVIKNSPRSIGFSLSGAPSQGQTIMLQNRRGKIKYVILAAVSGRVRVSESAAKESGE